MEYGLDGVGFRWSRVKTEYGLDGVWFGWSRV